MSQTVKIDEAAQAEIAEIGGTQNIWGYEFYVNGSTGR